MTLDDIKARCQEEGDCWIWQGAVSHAADLRHWGTPCMCIKEGGKRKTKAVRRVVWELDRGRTIPEGRNASPGCGNRLCVSPYCAKALTRKESAQLAAKRGAFSSPAKIRKGVMTRRARSHISDEMVNRVRAARTAKEGAEQTGMSLSHAKAIRRGAARLEYASNPFAGLMAGNDTNSRRAA